MTGAVGVTQRSLVTSSLFFRGFFCRRLILVGVLHINFFGRICCLYRGLILLNLLLLLYNWLSLNCRTLIFDYIFTNYSRLTIVLNTIISNSCLGIILFFRNFRILSWSFYLYSLLHFLFYLFLLYFFNGWFRGSCLCSLLLLLTLIFLVLVFWHPW